MGSDFRHELERAMGAAAAAPAKAPQQPQCYIQEVFNRYRRNLQNLIIVTPLPETVHLLDENFPYWIKLQRFDSKYNRWIDAAPSVVIPQLLAETFNDAEYRLEDPRRARALPHIPDLLRHPDLIFRNPPRCRIRGKYVYVQLGRDQVKVAFTICDSRLQKVILVSSFLTSWNWLSGKGITENRPVYVKPAQ